jgi:hypothetical protein
MENTAAHFHEIAEQLQFDSGHHTRFCNSCNMWRRQTDFFIHGKESTNFMMCGQLAEIVEDTCHWVRLIKSAAFYII